MLSKKKCIVWFASSWAVEIASQLFQGNLEELNSEGAITGHP